jgi:hypothetical protein
MTFNDTLRQLKEADKKNRAGDWDLTWEVVEDLSRDQGAKHVLQYVRELQLGVSQDKMPTVVSLVRFVTEQLAVVYRSPATRQLKGVSDIGKVHRTFASAYDRSGMQSILREVDRRRVRDRQCFVRLYPSDHSGRVKPVLFGPRDVLRWNESAEPDDMRADNAFGLRTARGLELWWRDGDTWYMEIVNEANGMPLEDQPFGPSRRLPYEELPVVAFFEGHADQPLLPPRESWRTYSMKLSAWHNEIAQQIKTSAHTERMFEQLQTEIEPVTPADMPQRYGPGMSHLLPQGVTARTLQMSPVIADTAKAMQDTVELWLKQENLPVDSFRQSQTVTGLGLRTLAQPLRERQESMRDFAIEAERRMFKAYAAVHNKHASRWGQGTIDSDKELLVTLGPIDTPMDDTELVTTNNMRMAVRLMSPIEALMRDRGIGRDEALMLFENIQRDWSRYEVDVEGAEAKKSNVEAVRKNAAQPDEVQEDSTGTDDESQTAQTPEGVDKAQDTALNGAQVQAAQGIVESVAARKLPRETGIAMLVEFFNIPQPKAEALMGDVGRSFFVEDDEPQPGPFGPPNTPAPGDQDGAESGDSGDQNADQVSS